MARPSRGSELCAIACLATHAVLMLSILRISHARCFSGSRPSVRKE